MDIRIDIAESQAQIFRLVAKAIADEFNDALGKAGKAMETRIRSVVIKAITDQPEWYALNGGQLTEEFGLTDYVTKLNAILRIWVNSIVVTFDKFRPVGNNLRGRWEISMIKGDWNDVLSAAEATQLTSKSQQLPWLQWLLIEGDKVIIREYDVGYGNKPGRAGGKIMIKTRGRWRVPPQYAGTTNDNFVTRAIDSVSGAFEQIFIDEVIKRL